MIFNKSTFLPFIKINQNLLECDVNLPFWRSNTKYNLRSANQLMPHLHYALQKSLIRETPIVKNCTFVGYEDFAPTNSVSQNRNVSS